MKLQELVLPAWSVAVIVTVCCVLGPEMDVPGAGLCESAILPSAVQLSLLVTRLR